MTTVTSSSLETNNKHSLTQHPEITSWKDYGKYIRPQGCNLLRRLDEFPNSILVTGSQRSGTTMTSEVLNQSDELVKYAFGRELSLDAALILTGLVDHQPQGRYCFQTTWLNECYKEYLNYRNGHKIIWVIRNPYSVVRSMLYNWPVGALDELYDSCGVDTSPEDVKRAYHFWKSPLVHSLNKFYFQYNGRGAKYLQRHKVDPEKMMVMHFNEHRVYRGVDRLMRACYSYNAKFAQLEQISKELGPDKLMIVEYNRLVQNKDTLLPKLFEFVNLTYNPEFANMIHPNSLKKAESLTERETKAIKEICEPVFDKALPSVNL